MPDYIELPRRLYTLSLPNFIERWNGFAREVKGDMRAEHNAAVAELCEALMLADGVSLPIHGLSYLMLPVLAEVFGAAGLESLLEQGAVEFLFAGTIPTDPEMAPFPHVSGSPAIAETAVTTIDPEQALKAGGQRIGARQLDRAAYRALSRRIAKSTIELSQKRVGAAIADTVAAYEKGALAGMGLDPEIARAEGSVPNRRLLQLINEVLESETIIDRELDVHELPQSWQSLRELTQQLRSGTEVFQTVERVLNYHRLPSIAGLIRGGVLTPKTIVDLRMRPETVEFRHWLWTLPDPRDASAASADYIGRITRNKADPKDSAFIKNARIFATEAFRIGLKFADAHFGFPSGVSDTVGVGYELIDAHIVDKFLTRKRPQRFATDVIEPLTRSLLS